MQSDDNISYGTFPLDQISHKDSQSPRLGTEVGVIIHRFLKITLDLLFSLSLFMCYYQRTNAHEHIPLN